ncbi:energy transducer TonB family protein [Sphingomonas sp. UNC305MFCol5.2]|uniref:energy transducer TonB family protein n=1 Tax=Sphingomonas sp. UNC305MFCol5.2 TaxID=1449076 RepID=UPI001E498F25|nr:TonB family protein [Sphingomonas sp. UNC305MFCol5.2]
MKLLTLTDRLWGLGMTTAVYGAIVPAMFLLSAGIGPAPARSGALKTFDVALPKPAPERAPRPAERKKSVESIMAADRPALPERPLPPAPAANSASNRAVPEPTTPAAAPPVPQPATPVAAPAAPGRSADSASAQRIYAARLWAHIAARRPPGIRIEGTAIVAFAVTRSGTLENVSLGQSSGNPMLDRLATRIIRQAAPFPAPPAELTDEQLRFTIPFSFR